MIENHFFVKNL